MNIVVEVQDASGLYILHQEIGHGTYGELEFDLYSTLPDGSLMVQPKGGKRYLVSSSAIAKAIMAAVAEGVAS